MACMKLGSKADVFKLEGQSWLCTTGLPSDVCIEVRETSFHLHKFPLLSRSQLLEKLINDIPVSQKNEEGTKCVVSLHDLPGGAESFLLVAKFCYGVKIELTATNIVNLRCAAEYLQMTEGYGEGNLISRTAGFLDEVLKSWEDTIKALETCDAVLPLPEELHIISRCTDFLATKACADLAPFSQVATQSPSVTPLWNGIDSCNLGSPPEEWWYDDVANLKLPLFKKLILAVGFKGMTPERIAGSVMLYAKRYLTLNGRASNFYQRNPGLITVLTDAEQKTIIEEITELLPNEKGATPTAFLLRLLRTSMILRASSSCRETLERRIGAQLDQAVLEDLLIPNTDNSVETLYDVECVQRIVDHFLCMDQDNIDSNSYSVEEDQLVERDGSSSLAPIMVVAKLLDDYLGVVASDANLKLEKFLSLAVAIPDYARKFDDGIYQAIDLYLQAHPSLTDSEKEQLCRLLNCQKLSIEASTHAAQNERLPLRVVVQLLFFEQLRLRTYVAGWLYVSGNSQNLSGNTGLIDERSIPVSSEEGRVVKCDKIRKRVSDLEKECGNMRQEIEKLVKTNGSWIIRCYKRFGLKIRTKSFDVKSAMSTCSGKALRPSRKGVLHRKHDHDRKLTG